MEAQNFRKINLKRKVFARGSKGNGGGRTFKRFKRTPQFIKQNVENQIARQKEQDIYHFSESEEEDGYDIGMGLDITDLSILDDNYSDKQKDIIALTQDSVRPLFGKEITEDDERKVDEGLAELRYNSFRPNQRDTINRILSGRSTLFISPTGSGKSLCYQLPALLYWRHRKFITIVVSPLISLMEDQMRNFPDSIKAVSLHSGHSRAQRLKSIRQLVDHEAQVAFVSPEAIVGGILDLDDLRNLPPVGFVCIDEAHCLSEWSHNFRPAYMQFFRVLSEQLNIKTFLGLTATATKTTVFSIARCLTINPETDVIGATKIPDNLILSVSNEKDKNLALAKLLQQPSFRRMTSILIYCNRREDVEKVAVFVRTTMQNYKTLIEVPKKEKKPSPNQSVQSIENDLNTSEEKDQMTLSWNSEAYHAGLSTEHRKRIQRGFVKGEIRVVVATVAFGMGINKSNIRAIIHYDMPASFENYVQEIGRAGRDGKPAQCHMFLRADKTDIYYQQRNIYASVTERNNLKKLTSYLFQPCRCQVQLKKDELEKLDRLNQSDPHELSSWYKTSFTDKPVTCSEEDLDEDELISDSNNLKENQPIKYVHKSVVKKHRACKGHELAFGLEESSERINLRPESIITLICQLQQAYPQLQIRQFTPIKYICDLHCTKGQEQMEKMKGTNSAVRVALFIHKQEHIKSKPKVPYVTPSRFKFDIVKVARMLNKPSIDVIKMLKKAEWELVDETGRFRRSQVKVNFDGNAFHIQSVGDLDPKEIDEINNFLIDYMKKYECIERNKVAKVYNTFKQHSMSIEQMTDKIARLDASRHLKATLDTHFNPSIEQHYRDESKLYQPIDLDKQELDLPEVQAQGIRKDARAFISAHGKDHTQYAIARIFQGISTPNYPSEHWGPNRMWWRIHPDVDFIKLSLIIKEELMR